MRCALVFGNPGLHFAWEWLHPCDCCEGGASDGAAGRAARMQRKWHHQTRMSRARNVKNKEKVSRADEANGRASHAVRRRYGRLSLVFEGFPPSRNFCSVAQLAMALLVCYHVQLHQQGSFPPVA